MRDERRERRLRAEALAMALLREAAGDGRDARIYILSMLGAMLEISLNGFEDDDRRQWITMRFIRELCARMDIKCEESSCH